MAEIMIKSKKISSLILCCLLALSIAVSGAGCKKDEPTGNKKPSFNILTEEEIKDKVDEDVLDDIDPDGSIDFTDQEDIEEIEVDKVISINNKKSVNDSFLGFGAVYYPWLYWEDGGGRNYTEEQRQIELDRVAESGTTWIRCVIYARPEWYDNTTKTWKYSGVHYEGLVKFFEEIEKRGIEVMLNFEWGGAIQGSNEAGTKVFENATLAAMGTLDNRIAMFGDFCSSFTAALKKDGIDCVKYITFYSEPANRKELGGQADTPEFESVFLKFVVPLYTKLVKSAHDSFTKAGIRSDYKFVGNNQSTYFYLNAMTYEQLKPLYDPVKDYLDEFSYHFYNRVAAPKGATYDTFNFITESYANDVLKYMNVKTNDTWIDETNVIFNGTSESEFVGESQAVGPIYTLRNDPYTATQLANCWLSFLNNGYKTATIWTLTSNLWPGSIQSGSEFLGGTFMCGLMPNLMDSQVPYNTYYTYSLISRYCTNAKAVYAGDNIDAYGMASSCVYDKDGNVTIFVVNSNLEDVEYKVSLESSLGSKVLYRHLYDPQTFEANTAAKPIGVDRVLINVSDGFIDKIPAGAVAVYTTSKK